MPVYTYGCEKCGRAFDVRKTIDKRNETESCECGGSAHKDFVLSTGYSIGVPKAQQAEYPYVGRRPQ